MWQIILEILAIIGIILLVLIGIIVVVVCLLLFVPVRYKALVDIDTTAKKYSGEGKASWLLKMVTLSATYPEPAKLIIRLFGIPIKVIDLKSESDETNQQPEGDGTAQTTEPDMEDTIEGADCSAKGEKDVPTKEEVLKTKESTIEEENKTTKPSAKEVVQTWYEKILYTIRNRCDKIKEIWNNIEYYKDLLNEKANRKLFERSKKRVAKLLKGIAPKRCKGQLLVGTGSPDTTGYLMALYGMLVPYLDKDFSLSPDFEEAICQGRITLKGRIYFITVLIFIISFARDKQLFILLKKLKREEQ